MIRALLAAVWLAAVWPAIVPQAHAATCAVAEEPSVPALSLPLARAAVARTGRLVILGVGGAPMAGAAAQDPGRTYLARLAAHLSERLPGVQVSIVNKAVARRTAKNMVHRLAEDLEQARPNLVLWESGGREAATGVDVGVYARALEAGLQQIRAAGADVLLIDSQFSPGFGGLVNSGPYRETMRSAADAAGVAVLPRHDLMTAWSEGGALDLLAEEPAVQLAVTRKLFDCLGDRFAASIAAALR